MTTDERYAEGDDDLPVLTHVLRTGNGRLPRSLMTPVDDSYVDEFGNHHFEDAPLTRQIVIGHDPHQPIDDLVSPTPNGEHGTATRSPAPVPRPTHRDPFRLSQDTDFAVHGHVVEPIDEPHIAGTSTGEDPGRVTLDRSIEFPRPSAVPDQAPNPVDNVAMAARLRDSIFTDLASRIDPELDARIAQVLRAEIESALAQLQNNLRSHLTEALRDLVGRAVDEEIARIHQKPR